MIELPKYSVHQRRHDGKYELWMQHDQDTHDVLDESYDKSRLIGDAQFLNEKHRKTLLRNKRRGL